MDKRRVCLVVEDDDDIRSLISVVLTRAGFEVRAVRAGAEGVAAAAESAVSLITLDMGLPDMDGHLAARAIRALNNSPLLFLTAKAESDDILQGWPRAQLLTSRSPSARKSWPKKPMSSAPLLLNALHPRHNTPLKRILPASSCKALQNQQGQRCCHSARPAAAFLNAYFVPEDRIRFRGTSIKVSIKSIQKSG